MSQETSARHPICLCSDDVCHCTIEVLRDSRLQALLLASQEDVSDGRLRFFPRESLLREISPPFISKVLQKFAKPGDNNAENVQEATNRVCPRGICYCKKPLCTGNRVIFASLLFAGVYDIFVHFLDAAQPGNCDSSLWRLSRRDTILGDEDPIFRQIQQLKSSEKQLFHYWEHQLRPICFAKTEDDKRVRRLGLEDGVEDRSRLPWTSIESPTKPFGGESTPVSTQPQIVDRRSARVEKICIHRSHHTLDDATNSFALKTFQGSEQEFTRANFVQELRNNNALLGSDRIVSLLAALEHRGNFYLLFPWADLGDLRAIWEGYSPRPDGAAGQTIRHAAWYSPRWLLEECLGIASAVAEIHGLDRTKPLQPCLLHADIKPDNILCFYDRHQDRVYLKLADFGHSHVLESPSSSVQLEVDVRSYRAPEYDTQDIVTTKYDVWSLGCLFLDFVTWSLLDGKGIEEFDRERLNEPIDPKANNTNEQEDTFFKRVAGRRGSLQWSELHRVLKPTTHRRDQRGSFTRKLRFTLPEISRAVVTLVREPVLMQFKKLRETGDLHDSIRQLLGIIEGEMLVIDYEKRAQSDKVQRMIREIL